MVLPASVRILEVGPRDGFQSISTWIDTPVKLQTIQMLLNAGVDGIEAVSFVSPKAIPQMRDAAQIVEALGPAACDERLFALVPNEKGAKLACQAGLRCLTLVISASEAHNQSNVRKTPAQSLDELEHIVQSCPGVHIKLSLATAFGCPFLGQLPDEALFFVLDGALAAGVRDICLCDTIGLASPDQVDRVLRSVLQRYQGRGVDWSLHLHNTRGLAAANTLAALSLGIDRFESAVAGLGGCPFAPGASGNMATEDLVYLLHAMGIRTQVDLDAVIRTAEFITGAVGCCCDSKINAVTARPVRPNC